MVNYDSILPQVNYTKEEGAWTSNLVVEDRTTLGLRTLQVGCEGGHSCWGDR